MDSRTARLSLHAVDELEAQRIRDRAPQPGDAWAADYPFEGDLAATVGFLRATEQNGEQRPFGYYQIRLQSDGLAIGGVGFKGPPDGEVVEIGYGLAPSARGHGYAAEALGSLMQIAADLGVTTIRADTDLDNVASQRTLEHAGFHQVEADSSCITTRSVSAKCGRSRNALLRLRACDPARPPKRHSCRCPRSLRVHLRLPAFPRTLLHGVLHPLWPARMQRAGGGSRTDTLLRCSPRRDRKYLSDPSRGPPIIRTDVPYSAGRTVGPSAVGGVAVWRLRGSR